MTITSTGLTRAAALAAVTSGLIFIGVQINHPPMVTASVDTTEWVIRNTLKVVMAALALAGITGMYLRQNRRMGVFGLIGYVLISIAYLVMGSVAFISGYVLPGLAKSNPGYVQGLLDKAAGNPTTADLGPMSTVISIEGFFYIVGGVVFGIALYRAGVLARWAAALLVAATLGTVALAVLPASFDRPMAVPTGVAFIGLGVSLLRDQRAKSLQNTAATSPAGSVTVSDATTRPQAAVR
jgi:hypothetical protein